MFKCSDRVKVVNEYSFQHTGYSKEWIIAFGVVTLLLIVSLSISTVTCIKSLCVKKKRKTNPSKSEGKIEHFYRNACMLYLYRPYYIELHHDNLFYLRILKGLFFFSSSHREI